MRIVILLDRPLARRERNMLSRLEIGLADEGVRVLHAVPRAIAGAEAVGLYSRTVGYELSGFPVPLRVRVQALTESLREAAGNTESDSIDLIHCLAPSTWRIGLETARLLGAAAALEIWSLACVAAAGSSRVASHPVRPAFTVADAGLLRASAGGLSRAGVFSTPWGVHGETMAREPLGSNRPIGVLMLLSGSHPAHIYASLEGFAAASTRDPRLMAFINTERATGHVVWRLLRKFGLTDRVSLIPDAEARRDAILHLDALVVPEPGGRLRSMALNAMACGMIVLAAPDPALEIYRDGVTARLVNRADATSWEAAFLELGSGAATVDELGRSAAAWVAGERPASGQVGAVIRAYEAILREHHAAGARRAA